MITAGIDVGSTYTKAVLLDDSGRELARRLNPTGFKLAEVSRKTFEECCKDAGLDADAAVTDPHTSAERIARSRSFTTTSSVS